MCQKGCSYTLKGKALVIEHSDHALGCQSVLVRVPPIVLTTGSPELKDRLLLQMTLRGKAAIRVLVCPPIPTLCAL